MIADVVALLLVVGAFAGALFAVRARTRAAEREAAEYERAHGPLVPVTLPVLPAPPPLPPGDHSRVLRASRDQAVLLRRDFPSKPGSLDHWGGVPLVPRGFTWPFFVTAEGEERALHHLLQLDCASIPEQARLGLMPDRGMLYVFLDLDWGVHWKWSVRYESGDVTTFVPATVPASLPKAYSERGTWGWVRRDEDWPQLLPHWSIDPVVLTGEVSLHVAGEENEELEFWPGTIPVDERLQDIPGAIVPSRYFQNTYDADHALVRPYANYPHDWQAVRILMGHCAKQVDRGHLKRYVDRGDKTEAEAADYVTGMRQAIESWSQRSATADPWTPLDEAGSDAVWQFVLDHQIVTLFALTEAVNDAIDATISASPYATEVLPDEALELVRGHHALATRDDDGHLHVSSNTARMLCPPSFVQGDAAERIGEWLLLLEVADTRSIGHHLAEGVYQFWIRPADLAARRFDLVELTGSAY